MMKVFRFDQGIIQNSRLWVFSRPSSSSSSSSSSSTGSRGTLEYPSRFEPMLGTLKREDLAKMPAAHLVYYYDSLSVSFLY